MGGTRQKSSWKKVSGKVLKFHTKNVLWNKSPFIKKSPEIKSYQFETLFSGTFFWLQYDFIQKSPLTSENAWKKTKHKHKQTKCEHSRRNSDRLQLSQ